MPEVKNTFIQSKMNKDLDGRIIPNGQYRDGRNVQISRSQGEDVGALENVLGNLFLTDFGLEDENLVCIGKLLDDTTNNIYLFVTNYTDCSANQLDNIATSIDGVSCYILRYNTQTQISSILVEGNFLNFSTTHLITGVNLLEDLLFWTDNRNQPRKINTTLAVTGYYTNEDQISVAKYYPYEPPLLLEFLSDAYNPNNPVYKSSMQDTTSEYLPIHTAAKVDSISEPGAIPQVIVLDGCYTNIKPVTPGGGVNDGNLMTGVNVESTDVTVTDVQVDFVTSKTTIEVQGPINQEAIVQALTPGDVLYFQFLNPEYNSAWPGDPDYLKERFVRFSYRFKFDDGEYSLSAPFTQLAFIPRQDGYFIGDNANGLAPETLVGQESETFDSTIVKFMENKVTNINLCLVAPTKNNTKEYIDWNNVNSELKVVEIDILYKEAQSNKTTILDTLKLEDFNSTTSNYLYYDYQSRKPWKTLPPVQTTRVTDVVPVRALAQEVSSNRVIYGNFVDKHTSPESLSYTLQIGDKPELPEFSGPQPPTWSDQNYYVRKEYQNHTLKQNRTYQVGVILSDRYGRQSNVILSDIQIDNLDPLAKGSTIYHSYKNIEDPIISDKYLLRFSTTQQPDTWPGDMLRMTFENVIPRARLQNGYPGVYSVNDGTVSSVTVNYAISDDPTPFAGCTWVGVTLISTSGGTATATISIPDPYTGVINVEITDAGSGWTNGAQWTADFTGVPITPGCDPAGFILRGNVFTPIENPLGWYSYKIVIKQTEQEYYNVYLPGALAGYPCNQNENNLPPLNIANSSTTATDPPTNPPTGTGDSETQLFGAIPKLIYPEGQQRRTSHLVLFSDNINKVPRDLEEVGPLQREFRSSERLYIRVESFLLPDNADLSYSSKQYKPAEQGDKVITIAPMTKLNLGNLITTPQTPIIPNLFYKGETDPLIARVQVENQFGISKYGPFNSCVEEFAPTATEAVPFNTRYGYGPTLAISETKPVESLIDIYWETSTSGLISELNFNIENSDNTIPSGISTTDISWSESDDYGTIISADFQAVGPTNNPLGASCSIDLVSVIDGNNQDVSSKFVLNDLGFGEYNISIQDYNFGGANGFICSPDAQANIFYFNFNITDLGTGIAGVVQETGFVTNRAPIDRGATGITDNLRNWIKTNTCDPANDLVGDYGITPGDNPRLAQSITLKAEQGEAKYGLTRDSNNQFFDQFIAPENNFANSPVNFGTIKTTSREVYYDAGLGPVGDFGGGGSTGNTCFASPIDRGGWASGFRNFGYFGQRTYYLSKICTNQAKYTNEAATINTLLQPTVQLQYYYDANAPFATTRYPDVGQVTGPPAPLAALYQGKEEGNQCDRNEFDIISGGLKTLLDPWDGVFTASNGAWGSLQPGETFPFGGDVAGIGGQIEWSIPRMYQVSMMIPFGETQVGSYTMGDYGASGISQSPKQVMDYQPAGEVVFGLYQDLIGSFPASGRNSILKYLPSGPIYWANDTSQLDAENVVGKLYNQRTDPTSAVGDPEYPHHYWPDLNRLLQLSSTFANYRTNPTDPAFIPNFMQLQNGANTFYQWNSEHSTWVANLLGVPNYASDDVPLGKGEWSIAAGAEKNILNYLFYLGGLDSNGLGLPTNKQKFFVDPLTPPSNLVDLSKCKINAGDPSVPAQAWNTPTSYGNGMPGGRYVVTLRATDKSGASDGLFYEWDVPIYLPWWATRTNAPLQCFDD